MSDERPAEDARPSAAKKRVLVAERAGGYCEYCRVAELNQVGPYNIEHVFPVSLGGTSDVVNLAWSCPRCNGSKSDHTELPDPETGEMASVFNPRTMRWGDHFEWCEGGALREMKADERGWVMGYVNGAIAKEFESRLPDAPRPARAD